MELVAAILGALVIGSIIGTNIGIRQLRDEVGKQTDVLLMVLEAVDDKSEPKSQ